MRVLCADREPLITRLLRARFERTGWRVACASTAPDALAEVDAMRPDAIVTDIQLVASTGLELIRAVRAHPDPAVAATPVVILSHLRRPEDVAAGLRVGADAYLTKPVDLVALQVRLVGLVAERGGR